MSRHLTTLQLLDYARGFVEESEGSDLLAHCRECDSCGNRLAAVFALRMATPGEPTGVVRRRWLAALLRWDRRISRSPLGILLDVEADEERARTLEVALAELEKLPKEKRQAIELLVVREPPLGLREAAPIQGAPISTVHCRAESALERVAEAMARLRNRR